jgi:hypothetical protein
MAKLVKHGSQGVADGTPAKDSFDMPETLPQIGNLELSKNTALYDKEAIGKDVLAGESKASVDDVATDKSFVEVSQGTIAPQQAGSVDTPVHDPDMTRFANQGAPNYEGKTDSLDDEESLKKPLGHKTSSGL